MDDFPLINSRVKSRHMRRRGPGGYRYTFRHSSAMLNIAKTNAIIPGIMR